MKPHGWCYGVTTVSERFDTYLVRTLESLCRAGFDDPHLFIDGATEVPPGLERYNKTIRSQRVRAYGNWVCSAWELYVKNPHAQWYAIFQDDFVCSKNLRMYLESCKFPVDGYLNLYTFPENEQDKRGWYLSNQLGKGAVGLVFSRAGLQALLKQEHVVDRPPHDKGWRNIDGAIVCAMAKAGYKEYVHNPSLIQHEGNVSSINNRVHQKAPTFRGEGFDCLSLLQEESPGEETVKLGSRCRRIGLVGRHCDSVDGALNLQMVNGLDIEQWMVKPHNTLATREPHPDVDTIVCYVGKEEKLEKFVRAVDVVVYLFYPVYNELLPMCRKHNRRTVCVKPLDDYTDVESEADLTIFCNQAPYDAAKSVIPSMLIPWPEDHQRVSKEWHAAIRLGQVAMSLEPIDE